MRTVDLTIPHSWEELSGKQLLFVSSLYLQGLTRNAFLAKAFASLAGLRILPGRYGDRENPTYLFKRRSETFPLTLGEVIDFSGDCCFLLQERTDFRPLPAIAGRQSRSVWMYDATFSEFVAALVYYNQFKNPETDTVFLDKLCAVMYPSGTWDSECVRYEEFEKFPLSVRYTAFLWFGTVLNRVAAECPDLFRASSGESEPPSLRENIHAMYNIVTSTDITKEKEVARMDMWRVLYDMDEKARRMKEANEKIEQYGRV